MEKPVAVLCFSAPVLRYAHPSVRYLDTTTPFTPRRHSTIFTEDAAPASLVQSQTLRCELIGLYYADSGPRWDSHGRAEGDCFHHIDLVIRSDGRIRHDGRLLELRPGHAYFFPGNTPIVRECANDYEVLWLRFRCVWFSGLDPLLYWPRRTPLCLGPWDREEWHVPLNSHGLPSARMLLRWQARMLRWFADALPDLDAILQEHAALQTPFAGVFDLIESNLGADLRMETLARAYGASVQAFSRHFTRVLGQTPKAHLGHRLNQQAIRLVLGSSLTMKEIAAKLRFSDEYYFSRFFSKMNGLSPSRYRHESRLLSTRPLPGKTEFVRG